MAGRILNRRELRKQSDQAEQSEAGATVKVRKPRKLKSPPRMRAL